jgi:hypothetical protein
MPAISRYAAAFGLHRRPPRGRLKGESNGEGIQITVTYVQQHNRFAVASPARGAGPNGLPDETVQRGLLRAPMEQDSAADGSLDPDGTAGAWFGPPTKRWPIRGESCARFWPTLLAGALNKRGGWNSSAAVSSICGPSTARHGAVLSRLFGCRRRPNRRSF